MIHFIENLANNYEKSRRNSKAIKYIDNRDFVICIIYLRKEEKYGMIDALMIRYMTQTME